MAQTPSNMIPLGTVMPAFKLPHVVTDQMFDSQSWHTPHGCVVAFICNHCPFVVHIRDKLVELGHHYGSQGIPFVAVSSNDVDHYPEDAPGKMAQLATELAMEFPYLYDASQEVARSFQAACTPDFYVFDKNRHLVYRGQFDDSRPSKATAVTGKDLAAALDCLLQGTPPNPKQSPSIGCNIKWKVKA